MLTTSNPARSLTGVAPTSALSPPSTSKSTFSVASDPNACHAEDDEGDESHDDLPPPLEDASAELASKRASATQLKHAVHARLERERERKANRNVDATTLADRPRPAPAAAAAVTDKPKAKAVSSGGLAGMKRGFLNSSSGSSGKKAALPAERDSAVPVLEVPKRDREKGDPLVFSDVQEALKEAAKGQMDPNLYVTPSLLGTIDSDAHLRSIFDDPGFAEFLALVEKDPVAAQKKYDPRTNPRADKYWKGMQRVTGLMGNELEKNAPASSSASGSSAPDEKQQKKASSRPKIEELDDDEVPANAKFKPAGPSKAELTPIATKKTIQSTSPPGTSQHSDLPPHERALVERVQSDARVREALMDPQIQRFLDGMRRGGGGVELGLFMDQASRNPQLMAKVQVLMEIGLLQVQR